MKGSSIGKRPLTAHASIPTQDKANSYAQQANSRRGKVSSSPYAVARDSHKA